MSLNGYSKATFSRDIEAALKKTLSEITSAYLPYITSSVADSSSTTRRLLDKIDIEVQIVAKGVAQQEKVGSELARLAGDDTVPRENLVTSFKSELNTAYGVATPADFSLSSVESARSVDLAPGWDGDSETPTAEPDESSGSTGLIVGVVGALVVVAGLAGFAAVKRKSVVSNPRSHRTADEVNAQYGVGIEVTDDKATGIV